MIVPFLPNIRIYSKKLGENTVFSQLLFCGLATLFYPKLPVR